MVSRLRYLPPRVQIAAGIALVAGFMLLSRRRMIEDVQHDLLPVPATNRFERRPQVDATTCQPVARGARSEPATPSIQLASATGPSGIRA